jgi:hypothetical protein
MRTEIEKKKDNEVHYMSEGREKNKFKQPPVTIQPS